MNYNEYLTESDIEDYSEYITEQVSKTIAYSEYIHESMYPISETEIRKIELRRKQDLRKQKMNRLINDDGNNE